ncbi:hypothetical protein M0813_02037 [Anaeramoeba flamelloides]|uniref:B box-type domain-containing protein n=1 Tax=Anaeramoeba flamelloides TaxID=1746091 RepID=A0ABQ8YQA5_9EUKA|nr:hypothetical protein M0813_02037 [Anaeramoeba flamelloides]
MTEIYEDLYLCDQCDNRSSCFCVNCSCGFCEKHNLEHHKVVMENHKRVAITPQTDFNLLLCSRHSYELNTYFCKDCSGLVCPKCKTTTHREHNVVLIEEMRNDLTEKVKIHYENYTTNKERSDKFFHKLDQLKTDLEQEQKEYLCDVESKFEQLLQIINKKKDEIVNKIQKDQKKKLDAVNEKIEKYNSLKKNFEEYGINLVNSFNFSKSPKDSSYLFVAYGSKLPKDTQYSSDFIKLSNQPLPKSGFDNQLLIDSQIKSLKKISLSQIYDLKKTIISNKEQIRLGEPIEIQGFLKNKYNKIIKPLLNIKFDLEIENKKNKNSKIKRMELRVNEENGGYLAKYIPKDVGKYSISGKINNEPIDVDNKPSNHFQVILPYCLKKSQIEMDKVILPNEQSTITLQLKDYENRNIETKFKLDFDLTVTGPSILIPLKFNKTQNEKGKYQTNIKLSEIGDYTLHVKIDGKKLYKSPYSFKIGTFIDSFKIPSLVRTTVDIMDFGNNKNTSQKPDIILLNNNTTAKNMWSNDASGHYAFGKMRLIKPKKYKFNIKINKRSGANLHLGIGKISDNPEEIIKNTLLWDCGKRKLIPDQNSKQKYGEQCKKGNIITMFINMQNNSLTFGKDGKLFDTAFNKLPNSCVLVFRLFGKKDQISFV